jgi:hypothetical protein
MPMGIFRWPGLAVLFLSVSLHAATPGKEEEFKAAKDASNEADKWAATQPVPEAAKPAATVSATQVVVSTTTTQVPSASNQPASPAAALPGVASPVPAQEVKTEAPAPHEAKLGPLKPGYNEMVGTILDVEEDPNVLRITLENGYNVGFTFDDKTVMTNGGSPIKIPDLLYGDTVQVRYFGKELRATEIERLKKAPRPSLGQ